MSLKDSIIKKIDAAGGKYEMIEALEKCKAYSNPKYSSDFDITIIYINAIYGGYLDNYCLLKNLSNIKSRLDNYIHIHKTYKCNHLKAMIEILENNINYAEGLRLLAS